MTTAIITASASSAPVRLRPSLSRICDSAGGTSGFCERQLLLRALGRQLEVGRPGGPLRTLPCTDECRQAIVLAQVCREREPPFRVGRRADTVPRPTVSN